MTNRELLELAAKAAGLKLSFYDGVHRNATGADPAMNICAFPVWNPLNDDGDALRLAVKLRMTVCIDYAKLKVSVWDGRSEWGFVSLSSDGININKDPCTATRRAIVRAAAEIGRAMK